MIYGLKYSVPFKTLSEISCEVRIEEKGYSGAVMELKGGENPIVIRTGKSDLLAPVRSSLATVSVFGSDYLQDLYASDPQGVRVKLIKGGEVAWIGFLKPDTFSQDFTSPNFVYDLECVAAFSTLKYKEFDLEGDFVSFWEIIDRARVLAGYEDVYYTNSVKSETADYFSCRIATANFFDELGEAMSYYEALEEIAKYAGCCWVPFESDLYFLDYQAIRSGYTSYTKNMSTQVTLQDLKAVSNYKGTNTKLSRIAGKNKAAVNCSLYEVKNLIPAFDEKGSSVFSLSPVSEREETVREGKEDVTYKAIIRRYTQPNFIFYHYLGGNPNNRIEATSPAMATNTGSGFVRTTEFKRDEPPSRLAMVNELQIKTCNSFADFQAGRVLNGSRPVLKMKSDRTVLTHKDVWFCISLQFKRSVDEWNKSFATNPYASDVTLNTRAKLKLGNLYYNGSGWGTTETTFQMPSTVKKGTHILNTYYSLDNQNSYERGLGDLDGFIFKAPDMPIIGDLEFTLYCPPIFNNSFASLVTKYIYCKNIELSYAIPDESSIYGDYVDKDSKNDVIYENVINDGYVEKADEIDLKICTNTDGKLALSSVLEGDVFLEKIRTDVFGTGVPEEILLQRVISLFSKPRYVIDPVLKNDTKPYTKFTEPHLNRQFLIAGGDEDVKMERMRFNLIEL